MVYPSPMALITFIMHKTNKYAYLFRCRSGKSISVEPEAGNVYPPIAFMFIGYQNSGL